MSRGRSRHQASRRRAYSIRQREIRERAPRVHAELGAWPSDEWAAVDGDQRPEPTLNGPWTIRAPGRAGAA